MNILFDLDGTLTDSKPGIIACLKHALTELNLEHPSDESLENFIGPSLRDVFKNLLPVDSNETDIENAIAAYRDRFESTGLYENSLYQGIPGLLESLSEQGMQLYIATSKPKIFAEKILEHFGLSRYFEAIYGSELNGKYSIKSELIEHILTHSFLSNEKTVMVGDRFHDIEGALMNNIYPIGVLWGYGSEEELVKAGAKTLCKEPGELQLIINSSKT